MSTNKILAACARRLITAGRLVGSALRRVWIQTCYPGVSFGKSVVINSRVQVRVTDGGRTNIGAVCCLSSNVTVVAKRGLIEIGERGFVGPGSMIVSNESIRIGTDCLIGEYVTIRDQNHGIVGGELPFAKQPMKSAPIEIGNNVWIGAKATIVAGVTIGSGSVVAANAVVTKNVPSQMVVGGVPARVLRIIAPTCDNTATHEAA